MALEDKTSPMSKSFEVHIYQTKNTLANPQNRRHNLNKRHVIRSIHSSHDSTRQLTYRFDVQIRERGVNGKEN